MNRCTIGYHKWVEKRTYQSEPTGVLSGVMCFEGDVCDICGKHRYESKRNYGMKKIIYKDKRGIK